MAFVVAVFLVFLTNTILVLLLLVVVAIAVIAIAVVVIVVIVVIPDVLVNAPVPRRRVLGIRELSFLHGAGEGLFGRRGGPPGRPDAPESPASYSASVEESAAMRARPLPLPLRGPPMCEPTRFAGISSSFLLGAIECESLRVSKMV
jgi:hypothetical protein